MTKTEAERIAAAINQLRPDWPAASLLAFIGEHLRDRPWRDVAVALAWVACEAETRTPARVLQAGPWWTTAGPTRTDGTTRPPMAHERCPVHPGGWVGACSGCAADAKAAVKDEPVELVANPIAEIRRLTKGAT